MKRQKGMTPEDEPPRLEGVQYATGEEHRAITENSRKNEEAGPKQKRCSAVDASGGESKVQSWKEQYFTAEHRRIDASELWCWRRLLESSLDCKEIKPVSPRGNQPCIFIGRTDVEAPTLWPPDAESTRWQRL